jgi:nicotinamide-nucleotide amidase
MRAEVIAIGDELTTGARLDTNSQWLSAELAVLGIPVVFHTTATDTLEAGAEAFRIAAGRADVVVATGGLGPTADDLTRDVLAAVACQPLELSAEALVVVESRFARRGMAMPETNRRQALFPRGSRVIPNPDGTAPGLDVDLPRPDGGGSRVFALPGVPAEMKLMWRQTVVPALLAMQPERGTIVQRRIKCFGAGESAIEQMLPDLVRRGREPLVGITAHEATITLRIAARGRDEAACRALIAADEVTIRECLGPLVYGVEDDEVEDAAIRAAQAAGLSLATAEIGTQGRVAALLAQADARGGGRVFCGGRVLAPNAPDDPASSAERARQDAGADLGLAVGPPQTDADGKTTLDIVLVSAAGVERMTHRLGGGASLALSRAAKTAVDLVRRSVPAARALQPARAAEAMR